MEERGHSLGVGNRDIALRIAVGLGRGVVRRRTEFRYGLVREIWTALKRFAFGDQVRNVDVRELPQLRDTVASGFIDDRNRAVLAALCQAVEAHTFFEIGTNRGRTAWTVAQTNDELTVYTLDLPNPEAAEHAELEMIDADQGVFSSWQRGVAFQGTEAELRIEPLLGDSASFDFSPYEGKMDVVFIDGSHSYPYVRHDFESALRLLTPRGLIVWDDYPGFPGVLQAVVEAAAELPGPVLHLLGTRLAVWSREPLDLERLPESEHHGVSVA